MLINNKRTISLTLATADREIIKLTDMCIRSTLTYIWNLVEKYQKWQGQLSECQKYSLE